MAYRQLASDLREAIAAGRYPAGERLPTEAELMATTGLGRQTVRRAFQELATEGTVYRVPGRGTFAVPGAGRYLRSFGSIDDLMALSEDTELQVVEPLHVLASVETADRLQAGADTVMTMSFLRLHEGAPFCYTRVHLPMEVGRRLRELPEVAGMAEPGARDCFTLFSVLDRVRERPFQCGTQNETGVAADAF
ncbi:MAG: GntR family transcriptional regulator, partial [Streptosporangiaceae bacterium]